MPGLVNLTMPIKKENTNSEYVQITLITSAKKRTLKLQRYHSLCKSSSVRLAQKFYQQHLTVRCMYVYVKRDQAWNFCIRLTFLCGINKIYSKFGLVYSVFLKT